jgi:RNA polymerase sigma-70 factor (ECF subfamily)
MAIDWRRLEDDHYYASVCTTLYETCQRGILRYCVTRLGDALGAEVMQEVFVTMVTTLRTYRPGPPVESWLFGMAKHRCQQALRNRTRRQDIATAFGKDIRQQLHAEPSSSLGAGLEAREQATHLATCLTKLPELERIVLHWRFHRGLSVAESAEALDMSEAAVRKRLQRALRRLKELMDDDPTGEPRIL